MKQQIFNFIALTVFLFGHIGLFLIARKIGIDEKLAFRMFWGFLLVSFAIPFWQCAKPSRAK
jgi:Zn-dependent protease